MTVPVFYVSREQLAGSSTVRLDGPEGRHAALVRRLQPRERIDLTDGAGLVAHCVVLRADGPALDLEVRELRDEPAPSPRLTVVQALAKGDRGETAVETMTEIGVDVIVPWSASRSITQWKGERGAKSLEKWRGTAREAAKQSRRAWWPEVTEPATTSEVAKLLAGAALPIVLHEEAELALAELEVPKPVDAAGPVRRSRPRPRPGGRAGGRDHAGGAGSLRRGGRPAAPDGADRPAHLDRGHGRRGRPARPLRPLGRSTAHEADAGSGAEVLVVERVSPSSKP